MRNSVMTRWDRTPHEKFQAFFSEFINYLRKNLLQVIRFPDVPVSELLWVCLENFTKIMNGCGDRDFKWRCIRSGLVSLIWGAPQTNKKTIEVLMY
jgi:hypothetical protein